MPIDASIAMGVKPFQLESPTNSLASILQIQNAQQSNQLNQMKMDEYKSGIADQNALRQIISGFGTDTAANQQALLKGGRLKEATEYAKGNADLAKTRGEAEFKKIETAHKRMDLMGQAFGFVKDNPTIENAFGAVDYLVSNGIMPAEAAAASKAKLQGNPSPENIRALATQAYQSALSTKDQLPVLGDFNGGGAQQFTSTNPVTGKVTNTGSIAITESANNVANNKRIAAEGAENRDVQIRGQDKTDERARDLNTITKDNKPLTEGQSKSALFGSRMAMANKIFDTLEKSGTTTSTPGMNSGYGVGSVVSALSSADQQQLMQAKRDFLNAVLRRESGAVIGESEFAGGEKQYFPQIGDEKKTIAQKKSNREAAMRGVLIDVPEKRRAEIVSEITGTGQPASGGGFKYLGTE